MTFFMVAFPAAVRAAPAPEPFLPIWPVELQRDVTKAARRYPGEFAFYIKDVQSGVRYTFNAATPMYLASGIKILVMAALLKKVEAKEVRLSEQLVYGPEDLRDGSPLLSYLKEGTPVSIEILLQAMIQQSDNTATDMIIRRIGHEALDQLVKDENLQGFGPVTTLLGVRQLVLREIDPRTQSFSPRDIFVLRMTQPLDARIVKLTEMLDEPLGTYSVLDYYRAYDAYYAQGYNSASMEAMGELLERIVTRRLVSPRASIRMMRILRGTQTGVNRIRAGLPAYVELAHKTGTQFRRTCDFGVFFLPGERPIVVTIAVKNGRARAAREALMARLVERSYWHLSSPAERRRIRAAKRQALKDESSSEVLMAKPRSAQNRR